MSMSLSHSLSLCLHGCMRFAYIHVCIVQCVLSSLPYENANIWGNFKLSLAFRVRFFSISCSWYMSQRFDVHWKLFFSKKLSVQPMSLLCITKNSMTKRMRWENGMDVWIFSFQCRKQMGVETVQFEPIFFCGSVFSEMLLFVRELNGRP